jgi:hypothetical protein
MKRICWLFHFKNLRSVIINDLNVIGVTTLPPKHNSPLVIYTNRVVTLSVTSKQLKPVSWRYPQVFESRSIMYI